MASRRPSHPIALAVILLSAVALRGDVLILKDGSRISGHLTYCDDEICSIDKRRIAVDQIAQIGLGDDSKLAPGRSGAAIILTDGTSRRGRFTGLNLGYVSIDEEEIERELVAVIFPGVAGKPAADLLVAPDGSSRAGTLERCNAASCTLDGALVVVDKIRWIGLGQEGESPPSATEDTIFFVESDPVAASLFALDATHIETTRGSFPRAGVTWIYVAPPQPTTPPGTGGAQRPPARTGPERPPASPAPTAPPRPPAPPEPTAEPPESSPPPPPPAPSGATDQPSGTQGALWNGTIQGRYWDFNGYSSHVHTFVIQLRARESIYSTVVGGKTIYQSIMLRGEDLSLAETYTHQEHFAGGSRCEGSGETRGIEGEGVGWLWLKKRDIDLTPYLGFDLPANGGIYLLNSATPLDHGYTIHCRNTNGSWSGENGFLGPLIGRQPNNPWSGQSLSDPEVRYLEGGRMHGSFETTIASYLHTAVSWSLCREGDDCPPPPELPGEAPGGTLPPPPPSDDPCGEIAARQAEIGRIGRQAAELRRDFNEKVTLRDAARDGIWGFDGALAKFFNSLGGLAAEGISGVWGSLIGLANANLGLWQDLNDFSEIQAAIEVASLEGALDPATRTATRAACQAAEQYIAAHPDDVQGAFNILNSRLDSIGAAGRTAEGGIKVLAIGTAVIDYAQNTQGLADGLSGYFLARQEAANVERDLERLDEQIRDLQMEIEELRARCARQSGAASTREPRATFAVWRVGERAPVLLTAQATPPPGAPEGGEDPVLAKVRQLTAQLAAMHERLDRRVTPKLLPFMTGDWRTVDPRLLQRLVLEVRPDLQGVGSDLERAQSLGREIDAAARAANPEPPI